MSQIITPLEHTRYFKTITYDHENKPVQAKIRHKEEIILSPSVLFLENGERKIEYREECRKSNILKTITEPQEIESYSVDDYLKENDIIVDKDFDKKISILRLAFIYGVKYDDKDFFLSYGMAAPYTHNHYISLKSACNCKYELRPDKYPYKSIKESKKDYLTYAPLEAYSVLRNIEKDFDYQKLALETSEAIKSYDVNTIIDVNQRLKYVSLTNLFTLIPRMEWLKGNLSVIKQCHSEYQKDVDNGAIELIENDKKALKVFLNQIYGKESPSQK